MYNIGYTLSSSSSSSSSSSFSSSSFSSFSSSFLLYKTLALLDLEEIFSLF